MVAVQGPDFWPTPYTYIQYIHTRMYKLSMVKLTGLRARVGENFRPSFGRGN
jgi:hypothetical protein